jgi:peptidoglycan/LPS O-acetylase OafA/YrhL
VIYRASLEYQYGPVAAVSWSISVEVFFYLVYVALAPLIARATGPRAMSSVLPLPSTFSPSFIFAVQPLRAGRQSPRA